MFDGEAFGNQVVEIVRSHVERTTTPLIAENKNLRAANDALAARIEALEAREFPASVTAEEVRSIVSEAVPDIAPLAERISELEAQPDIKSLVAEEVATAVAAIPEPQKGEPGEVDMEMVAQMLSERVSEAIKAIPVPQDGKDGIGLADAMKDENGDLVLVMTDGRTRNLGRIVGKDGKDGETFTLDDFDVEPIDERTIKLGFVKGDVMHSFELAFPFPIYRGVFKAGEQYERGDLVSWGGSVWHCDKDTGEKPDGSADWSLAVRKGRDGK